MRDVLFVPAEPGARIIYADTQSGTLPVLAWRVSIDNTMEIGIAPISVNGIEEFAEAISWADGSVTDLEIGKTYRDLRNWRHCCHPVDYNPGEPCDPPAVIVEPVREGTP